ncbi:MAG TPA: all-trans-retinol 13,14-reductase [Cytophagales bacterium]|nr:all-trans-retinol 13,14-reductase [Cytophagales bacterium]HRG10589.1 NAD(P)/FAD-dependent oxidoreductase [Cyclobacteriaceae bacterium]
MEQYDVVIVGSGLGGLACGTMLAKEGYKVCVIEKNKQIGGNLQTFVREGVVFDSGVHYVGGLDKGQNLYQLFKYLGIMDKLKLRKLDEDVFDAILFEGDPVVYKYAQGYENFIRVLAEQFPEEEAALRIYCDKIKDVCSRFPLYNLRKGDYFDKIEALEIDTKTFIESITSNKKLQNVLAGTSLLYAGEPDKTPLYVHALVLNSYIESSWRFVDGGSQIARYLSRQIVGSGGRIINYTEVVKFVEEGDKIAYVESSTGEKFYGNLFISNLHPAKTLEMTESDRIKKAFRTRIHSLENSISVFYVNVVLKPKTMKYVNHNYYYFAVEDTWSVLDYKLENWPMGFAFYYSASSDDTEYCDGVTVMTYMRFDEVAKWKDTFNTVANENDRGVEYDEFKKVKSEMLFDMVEAKFPGFKDSIQSYYTATPLTVRDYIGTDDGSLYGITKDYREPMRTFISPRTKISNLYLTGQNLNLHGVLGVTVNAVMTCSQILGIDYMLEKIKNA